MRSRSIASSCKVLHHKAALIRGWFAMMSITTSRPIAAIRVGPMVTTEWSVALSTKPCRSHTSPGIRTVNICRLPSGSSRYRHAMPRVTTNASRGASPSTIIFAPARKRSSRRQIASRKPISPSVRGAKSESLATSGFGVSLWDAFNSGSSLIQARRFWLGNVFADALQLAPYRA
jgi:hypothetical protein